MGLEIFQLISGQKVCHYLSGDKGEVGQSKRWQTVTRGEGVQNIFISLKWEVIINDMGWKILKTEK